MRVVRHSKFACQSGQPKTPWPQSAMTPRPPRPFPPLPPPPAPPRRTATRSRCAGCPLIPTAPPTLAGRCAPRASCCASSAPSPTTRWVGGVHMRWGRAKNFVFGTRWLELALLAGWSWPCWLAGWLAGFEIGRAAQAGTGRLLARQTVLLSLPDSMVAWGLVGGSPWSRPQGPRAYETRRGAVPAHSRAQLFCQSPIQQKPGYSQLAEPPRSPNPTPLQAGLGGGVDLGRGSWGGFRQYTFLRNSVIRAGGERAVLALNRLVEQLGTFCESTRSTDVPKREARRVWRCSGTGSRCWPMLHGALRCVDRLHELIMKPNAPMQPTSTWSTTSPPRWALTPSRPPASKSSPTRPPSRGPRPLTPLRPW